MIYDTPNKIDPIRQGDIFIGIPKVEIALAGGLPTIPGTKLEIIPWDDIVKKGELTTVVLPVLPVPAIVASQDCDARREEDITLCEIKPFIQFEKDYGEISNLRKRVRFMTRQSCINLKWFYLPLSKEVEFKEPMGVDFLSTINVPRVDLEQFINLRKCRLNDVARDHFRERLAHFYRRYAYNEWYPLNKQEMEIYAEEHDLKLSDWYDYQK